VVSCAVGDDFLDGAAGEQAAVGEISETMTPFGLIHVMRGNEDGEAACGEMVNFIPEVAARLGVDAGRRLVEEQQLGLVNQTRGQGEPLLPTARKLTCQLLAAMLETQSFEALLHGGGPIGQIVDAGDVNRDFRGS